MSIADWLDKHQVSGWLRKLIDVAYTTEMGLEIDQQSALNFLTFIGTEDANAFKIFGESDERFHVRGGNDLIPRTLAKRMAESIETGHVLEAVRARRRWLAPDVPPRWREHRRARAAGDPRVALHAVAQGADRSAVAGAQAQRDRPHWPTARMPS